MWILTLKNIWNQIVATWTQLPELARIIVIAGLVVVVMETCSHHSKDPLIAQAAQAKVQADSTLRVADSLRKVVVARDGTVVLKDAVIDSLQSILPKLSAARQATQTTVTREKTELAVLKTQTDSVALARTVIPKQDSIIVGLDSLLHSSDSALRVTTLINDTQKQEIAVLKVTEADLKASTAKLTQQVTQDKTTISDLQNGLKKKDKIFGLIPLPSRKAVAAITAIVTAVVLSKG